MKAFVNGKEIGDVDSIFINSKEYSEDELQLIIEKQERIARVLAFHSDPKSKDMSIQELKEHLRKL